MGIKIYYDYVEYGRTVSYVPSDTIYLDVGNSFAPGVIDHHMGDSDGFPSATHMIWILLRDKDTSIWKNADATLDKIEQLSNTQDGSIRIVSHINPDLDAFFSSYILTSYLKNGKIPDIPEEFIILVDDVDQGRFDDKIFKQENIYEVLEIIAADLPSSETKNEDLRDLFFEMLDKFITSGKSFKEFIYNHELGDKYRTALLSIRNLDEDKEDINVPVFERERNGFKIKSRNITWIDIDRENLFNIHKARYRKKNGPVWFVNYNKNINYGKYRFVLSVDGNDEYALFGYGWMLEKLEKDLRSGNRGIIYDGYPERKGTPRPGFKGADPWWDGRNSNYTIVDAPNSGTVLGNLNKEEILDALKDKKANWGKYFVGALLDHFQRVCATVFINSEQKNDDKNPLENTSLDKAVKLAITVQDYTVADKILCDRLQEGLIGIGLIYPMILDLFKNNMPRIYELLSSFKINEESMKHLGLFFMEDSSYKALNAAVKYFISSHEQNDNINMIPFNILERNITENRLHLLEKAEQLSLVLKRMKCIQQNDPPLYRIAEYTEILRQLEKWNIDDGNICSIWALVEMFYKLPEKEIISLLGFNNPLLEKTRASQNRLEGILKIKKIYEEFAEFPINSDDTFMDNSHIELMDIIISLYEMTMSLSGSKDRYCKKCRTCNKRLNSIVAGVIAPSKKLEKLCKDFISQHGKLPSEISEIPQITSLIYRFFNNLKDSPQIIIGYLEEIIDVITESRNNIYTADDQKDKGILSWTQSLITSCLSDIKMYCSDCITTLLDFEKNIQYGTPEDIEEMGANILSSYTFEQIYDKQADLLRVALAKLFNDKINAGKEESEQHLETIGMIRAMYHSRRLKSEEKPGRDKISGLLSLLYKTQHEELMDLPPLLKKNLLGRVISHLQNRMCIISSAKLLDAFQGRSNKRSLFIGPLIKLLLPTKVSLSAISSVCIPVSIGFFIAILFSGLNGFSWFFIIFFLWIIALLFQLLGSGRWLKSYQEKTNELEENIGNEDYENKPVARDLSNKPIGSLVSGQLLIKFVVPMVLSLSPFVLSDELKTFVYEYIDNPISFLIVIILFGAFSILALFKLQAPDIKQKTKNVMALFGILWAQSFTFSFFLPFFLQSMPAVIKKDSKVIATLLESKILGIPRLVEIGSLFDTTYYVFPASTIVFSFLVLFAAIFLEGLMKRE